MWCRTGAAPRREPGSFGVAAISALQCGGRDRHQLQGHVESRQAGLLVEFHPGDVVNRAVARCDHGHDFGESDYAAIAEIERATRLVAAGHEGEAGRSEQRPVVRIKWAIDKNRPLAAKTWTCL